MFKLLTIMKVTQVITVLFFQQFPINTKIIAYAFSAYSLNLLIHL